MTNAASGKSMLSMMIWRFRPSTYLALSRPLASLLLVVSTDWLSTLPVVRGEYGFSAERTLVRSESCGHWSVPSSRHCLKYRQTVLLGGKSLGKYRHWHPVRRT